MQGQWIKPHFATRQKEVNRFKARLPAHQELDEASVAIVMSKPLDRIRDVRCPSAIIVSATDESPGAVAVPPKGAFGIDVHPCVLVKYFFTCVFAVFGYRCAYSPITGPINRPNQQNNDYYYAYTQ